MPTPSAVQLPGYLPNETYPSDHLAIVYDFCWKGGAGGGGVSGQTKSVNEGMAARGVGSSASG